jgi:hypothetical protein
MSTKPETASEGEGGLSTSRRPTHGLIAKRAARFAACLGVAAAMPLASFGVASATPTSSNGSHPAHPARVAGTVAAVGTDSFTLTVTPHSHHGTSTSTTVTVNVSGTTSYREPTVKSPTFADVLVGEKVAAKGTWASAGTLDATRVFIPLAVDSGRVASLTTGGFTIMTAKGVTVTVNVSATTKFREEGVAAPTLANVAVGNQVRVIGTQGGTNTVNAISVLINPFANHGKSDTKGHRG